MIEERTRVCQGSAVAVQFSLKIRSEFLAADKIQTPINAVIPVETYR
jgi:hypothetical protein